MPLGRSTRAFGWGGVPQARARSQPAYFMQVSSAIYLVTVALFNFELVKELPRPLRGQRLSDADLCALQEAFLGEGGPNLPASVSPRPTSYRGPHASIIAEEGRLLRCRHAYPIWNTPLVAEVIAVFASLNSPVPREPARTLFDA